MGNAEERLIRHLEKENARLTRANEELLSKVLFLTGQEYDVTPAETARALEPEPEKPKWEDPDLPGYTSNPELVGV